MLGRSVIGGEEQRVTGLLVSFDAINPRHLSRIEPTEGVIEGEVNRGWRGRGATNFEAGSPFFRNELKIPGDCHDPYSRNTAESCVPGSHSSR